MSRSTSIITTGGNSTIRILVTCLALAALALSVPNAEALNRHVNPDGLCGGNAPCYTDIQSAIDASSPGDVIMVQAAVYSPGVTIDVHTSVTLYGPQAGINPKPSFGTTRVPGGPMEAIIDGGGSLGTILLITASDVELNGFEVRNGTGDLIQSDASIPTSNVTVRNNIIHQALGDEGIQLRAITGALIECNHVYDTAGDGINLCCGSVDGIIRWNEVHDIGSPDGGIYSYGATYTTIEGNLVYNTTNNDGIKLGSKGGSDAAGTGGIVLNNLVHNTAQDGISIYMSNTTVECNQVYASASENGGIYLAQPIGNVAVRHNYVHDNTFNMAKWGDPAGIMIGTGPDASTITVEENILENNVPNGMTNKAAALLVAENNWWGHSTGPSGAGAGTGDAVSTNVDFDPWLSGPATYSCPAVGDCQDPPTPVQRSTWGGIKTLYRD